MKRYRLVRGKFFKANPEKDSVERLSVGSEVELTMDQYEAFKGLFEPVTESNEVEEEPKESLEDDEIEDED